MVVVSYSGKEINAKLVYYGAGLSGKTTNLESIYEAVPDTSRGKMVSMKTQSDRTLFFDLLPLDLGEIMGFKTRFLLYTVPGQVFYNATRKLVLKGADAIVFVADSEVGKMEENKESLANLRANLAEYGLNLDQTPWVIQYNKRDLPNVYSVDELNAELNPGGKVPFFEAVATQGQGVFETFRGISHLLMEKVTRDLRRGPAAGRAAAGGPAQPAVPATPALTPEAAPAPAAPPKLGNTAPVPPGAAIQKEAQDAPPPIGSPNMDYGTEIDLPSSVPPSPEPVQEKAPAEPQPVHASATQPAAAPRKPTAPMPQVPVREPAGLDTPVSGSAAKPEVPVSSEPVLDGPSLDQPSMASPDRHDTPPAAAEPAQASGNEVVVPVKLPKGASREIVLRIVIRNED